MNVQPLQDFEANTFPLEPGLQLLEASAGTGKTFALAHLVLRLVTHPLEPLPLERLLVVTYTEAAAAELRDRIAGRLQQALAALESDAAAGDAVLAEWRAAQAGPSASHPRLRGLLLLALEALDRADITTIHGFCRRSLERHALEAGLGPSLELERDDGQRAAQVIHDYWQGQVLALPPELLAGLQAQGITPELLEKLLVRLDADPALELDPLPPGFRADLPLALQLPPLLEQHWQTFRREWAGRGAALEAAFCATAAELARQGSGSKHSYAARPRRRRVAELDAWIAGWSEAGAAPGYAQVLEQKLLREYFHPGPFTKVAAELGGEALTLPERPLLEAIAALVEGPAEFVLGHALIQCRCELQRRRARAGTMGFADLLAALDPGPGGDRHGPLLAAVGERYRVALVDEFQDTDPIQWRILERAFVAPAGQERRHLLVLVGDPKQAIYRFRGGELATYRLARRRADAIRGLRENRRSSEPLVNALNRLMAPGLVRSGLPVPAVLTRSERGELVGERAIAPLQLLPVGDDDDLPQRVAALCLQLLERGLRIRSRDPEGTLRERALTPADLCLLVARHSQAEALRLALEQRGLPSRLVSRGDVFASEAAAALQRLLDALAHPGEPGRQRLLAASVLLGWSAERLAEAPAVAWEQLANHLAELAVRLEHDGLLACLGELLSTDGLARLSLGGRLLADLQQVSELVQEHMHRHGLGAAAAADWLRRIRLEPRRRVPEEHQLNSTAADAAIAVVTVHRSKGLEYPVVICPYLWRGVAAASASASKIGRRWLPAAAAAPRLDLHRNPHWGPGRQAARSQQAEEEQEAERLAYVAATRARHLLVLGWRDAAGEESSPLAPWLLAGGVLRDAADLPLEVLDPAGLPAAAARWRPPAAQGRLEGGALPRHRLDTGWGRSSYSSWAHSAASLPPAALEEGRDSDAAAPPDDAAPPDGADPGGSAAAGSPAGPAAAAAGWQRQGPLATFARGAGAGEALHRILERLDHRLPADAPEPLALIAAELGRAGLDPQGAGKVAAALDQLRLTPFGGELRGFRLAELAMAERLNEMNFDLPLAVPHAADGVCSARVRAAGLARCFRDHPQGLFGEHYAARLEQLEFASRGFLTGSIDLVFRQGERWWVLDWKSNWLGERDGAGAPLACGPAHYGLEAMAELMAASHYPLQAHLYLVALHRYLRWRLPGYRPERHLGGFAYVFLRGVPGAVAAAERLAAAGAVVPGMLVEMPPLQRLLALDAVLREGCP